jgi:hypothetical protein
MSVSARFDCGWMIASGTASKMKRTAAKARKKYMGPTSN